MRSFIVALVGLAVTGVVSAPGTAGAAGGAPAVRTMAGPAQLSAPSGLALDPAGDLFIADTDHCRVDMIPDHAGLLYGMHVTASRTYAVAGGRCGPKGIGFPTGVAVDVRGDVYIADATGNRVLMVAAGGVAGPRHPVVVAGTGAAGYGGDGLDALRSALREPSGVAVDTAGDLFIADTANCLVRMVPKAAGVYDGQAMEAGHLYNVVGTGTCGSAGGGPARSSQIWGPVAVAIDRAGDILIADNGDQTVVEVPARDGTYYGTGIGAGDAQVIVGLAGDGNVPYLIDGLAATSIASELNDPEGIAVGPDDTLFVSDGRMHCIRVVPSATTDLFGRAMSAGNLYTLAGALPINNALGSGDGTRWILTHMDVPFGIAVSTSGSVMYSDRSANQVRVIG